MFLERLSELTTFNYSFQEKYFEIGRTGIPACSLKCDKQARMPVLPARKQLS
jgi:hypothetical protein